MEAKPHLHLTGLYYTQPVATILLTHLILHTSRYVSQTETPGKSIHKSLLCLLNKDLAKLVLVVFVYHDVSSGQRARELKLLLVRILLLRIPSDWSLHLLRFGLRSLHIDVVIFEE